MKYAILNTVDRPYERLVVEIIDGKAYYMRRATEESLRSYDGMNIRPNTTDMETFGFDCVDSGGNVEFTQERLSEAVYDDGSPRPWQGAKSFTLPRVELGDEE